FEADGHGRERSALELERRSSMRGNVDREALTRARTDPETPLGRGRRHKSERSAEGTEKRRDHGEVVRRDVEHRPATRAVEDVCVWVPVIRSPDEEGRRRSEGRADLAPLD